MALIKKAKDAKWVLADLNDGGENYFKICKVEKEIKHESVQKEKTTSTRC